MSPCAGEQLVELFHFTPVQYATICLHATCPVSPYTNRSIDSPSARLDTKPSSGTVRIQSSSKFATQCYGVRDNFSERDRHLGSLTLGLLTRNQVFESADSKSLRIYMYREAGLCIAVLCNAHNKSKILRRLRHTKTDHCNCRRTRWGIFPDHLLDVIDSIEVCGHWRHVPIPLLSASGDSEIQITLQTFSRRISPDERHLQKLCPGRNGDVLVCALAGIELLLLVEKYQGFFGL